VIFHPVPIAGAFLIELELRSDERGSFARSFCQRELASRGIRFPVAQCNLARSSLAGTVRGLHYQNPPAAEQKLVRCIGGAIFDVMVDMRPESATFRAVYHVRLDAVNRLSVLVPDRVAHGYQVLVPESEVFYMADEYYAPAHETGIRFDDPSLAIPWPLSPGPVADRDTRWPLLPPR
jgi:dTDP-4-dehydrorhamnose 3,5-epimerase